MQKIPPFPVIAGWPFGSASHQQKVSRTTFCPAYGWLLQWPSSPHFCRWTRFANPPSLPSLGRTPLNPHPSLTAFHSCALEIFPVGLLHRGSEIQGYNRVGPHASTRDQVGP